MPDYNPNTVSAYQQYASSMKSGGGGSNMSGLGSRTTSSGTPSSRFDTKGYTPTKSTSTKSGIAYIEGYGSDAANIPQTPEQIYAAAAQATTEVGGLLVPNITAPMIHAANLYSMPKMAEQVSDYVYRADRNDAITSAIRSTQQEEQESVDAAIKSINKAITQGKTDAEIAETFLNDMAGMGNDKPDETGGFGVPGVTLEDVTDTQQGLMTNPQPLYDFAEEMRNPSITTTELPSITPDQKEKLGAKLREASDKGDLSSVMNQLAQDSKVQLSSAVTNFIEGAETQVASNDIDPFTGKPFGNNELGYVPTGSIEDAVREAYNLPETGEQLPEDYNEDDYIDVSPAREAPDQRGLMSRPSFTEAQPEDSMLGGLFKFIPDAFQVSNYLTGGTQLDGSEDGDVYPLRDEEGPVLYPSNTKSVKTYVRDMYPDNPEAAAALAATIESEGMYAAEENIGKKGDYKLANVIKPWMKDSKQDEYRMRTSAVHAAIGLPIKKDKDGNNVLLKPKQIDVNKAAQLRLNTLGFDVGEEDGIVGKNTVKGIKAFQNSVNLPATGKLDKATLNMLPVAEVMTDHKGNLLYEHDDSKAPKYIPGDKAEDVFNIFYNDYYRTDKYKLGNEGADVDAGKFIGRGPVQITGKEMYKKIGDKIGVDLVSNPELIATNPAVSIAATKVYLDMKGFDKLSPKEAIKVINPGMGQDKVDARMKLYNKYLKEMQE